MSQAQESEAIYAEVSSPPIAESFDMDENKCYGGLKVAPQKIAAVSDGNKNIVIAPVVTIVLIVMLVLACCIAFALEIFKLKSETASSSNSSPDMLLQQLLQLPENVSAKQEQSLSNIANKLDSSVDMLSQQLLQLSENVSAKQEQSLSNIANKLENFLNSSVDMLSQQLFQLSENVSAKQKHSLNNIANKLESSIDLLSQQLFQIDKRTQQLKIFINQQVNDLQIQTQQIRDGLVRPGKTFPVSSCASLLPFFPSGYYWVRASNGSAVRVYCDMTRSCGGVTGGWTRVVELDMTNSSHQCPSGSQTAQ